jgi:glutamate dehydrogenase/leucine dehydrogenase
MRRAYATVRGVAREKPVDLRTAALIVAIRRVGHAALARTSLRQSIELSRSIVNE